MRSLGADDIYDYTQPNYIKEIAESRYPIVLFLKLRFFTNHFSNSRYDIILDCAKYGIEKIPNEWKFKQFITLNSPLMLNTDRYGILGGLLRSTSSLLTQNMITLKDGKVVKWGFFIPSSSGFKFINHLVKNDQVSN